ncbi:MAG TPA: hypothetical protein VIY86_06400, partial [Pirellulaceae bacterium]
RPPILWQSPGCPYTPASRGRLIRLVGIRKVTDGSNYWCQCDKFPEVVRRPDLEWILKKLHTDSRIRHQ